MIRRFGPRRLSEDGIGTDVAGIHLERRVRGKSSRPFLSGIPAAHPALMDASAFLAIVHRIFLNFVVQPGQISKSGQFYISKSTLGPTEQETCKPGGLRRLFTEHA